MKLSWVLWWIVSIFELASFTAISLFLWFRDQVAGGVTQTIELKWVNIGILFLAFIFPFLLQLIWLIFNIVVSKRQST